MAIVGKYTQQPSDRLDYDISFVEWLAERGDTQAPITPATVTVDDGLTLISFTTVGGVVKVWLTGGISGTQYKVTVTLTTTGGRIKQDEIVIKVKES